MDLELAVDTLHDLAKDLEGSEISFPSILDDFRRKKSNDLVAVRSALRNLLSEVQKKTTSAKETVAKYDKPITYSGHDHDDPKIQEIIDEQRAIYWRFHPVEDRICETLDYLKG